MLYYAIKAETILLKKRLYEIFRNNLALNSHILRAEIRRILNG